VKFHFFTLSDDEFANINSRSYPFISHIHRRDIIIEFIKIAIEAA
jgi:hypothetical protein